MKTHPSGMKYSPRKASSLTGSFSGTLGTTFTWNDPWDGSFNLVDPAEKVMNPAASAIIGFSAKPSPDLGFYGEIRTAYPFVSSDAPDIRIFKLYSKFNWNDYVFFSFGKQPLKWGQGYFFAPANDIFSLSAIDLEDPEAEREGPLSLRINTPVPGTLANFYLFTVFKSSDMDPLSVAIAPKFEIGFPGFEIYAAGYYQKDEKPKFIAGGSFARNGLSLFGESVLSFGSNKVFLEKTGQTYSLIEKPDALFFTGTFGAMYVKSWEKKLDLTVVGQYLYDGEGQNNLSLYDLSEAKDEIPSLTASIPRFGTRLGRHYGALTVSAGNILDSSFSASVLTLANLGDFSGFVKPQVSWKIFDRMSVSFWSSVSFGGAGDEYTNLGGIAKVFSSLAQGSSSIPIEALNPVLQAGIEFSLGSGTF